LSTYREIEKRREKITKLIHLQDSVSVEKLSSLLGVSEMTVRRDLNILSKKGSILRLRGVALKIDNQDEAPYLIRSLEMKKEKQSIGQKAASLVKEGDVVLLDVGSTIIEVLKNIINIQRLQIITHWIPVAIECKINKHSNVVILGGKVDLTELSIGGGGPEEMLKDYVADIFFLGVSGISTEYGLTDYRMEEVRVKRQMIKNAKKVIAVADHSKFGHIAPIKICELNDIDKILTDSRIDQALLNHVRDFGISVLTVDV